jgi:hypothetical protein
MNVHSLSNLYIYIYPKIAVPLGWGAPPAGSAQWLGLRVLGFGIAAKTVFSVKRYKPREGEVD